MRQSRRAFLQGAVTGAAGSLLYSGMTSGNAHAAPAARVGFGTGSDRRDIITDAMRPFEDDIRRGIEGKQVILKPNCVWQDNELCATHVDALRAVLDFLHPLTDRPVIIAEASIAPVGTLGTFEQYGYTDLTREYNVSLMDLNRQSYSTLWIADGMRHPLGVRIIDTYLDDNTYIISVARMKTHDCVFATMSMKNMLMGSPLTQRDRDINDKSLMHEGGVTGINHNMFLVARHVRPSFSVVDGFVGMEGNGPIGGTAVEHGVALAGTDGVAVDRIGLELMGVPFGDVAYLLWCSRAGYGTGTREDITVIGPAVAPHVVKYRLHEKADNQHLWKEGSTVDPRI